jgi:hypothetical protein
MPRQAVDTTLYGRQVRAGDPPLMPADALFGISCSHSRSHRERKKGNKQVNTNYRGKKWEICLMIKIS